MDNFTENLIKSIRARDTLIYVQAVEEQEALKDIITVAYSFSHSIVKWNAIEKFEDITPEDGKRAMSPMNQPEELIDMLNEIDEYKGETGEDGTEDVVFVLQDVKFYTEDINPSDYRAKLIRRFKILKQKLKSTTKTIIVLGKDYNLPTELEEDFILLKHERPSKEKLHEELFDLLDANNWTDRLTSSKHIINEIIEAARGLTLEQARSGFTKAILEQGKLDNKAIPFLLDFKKQIIEKNKSLEYYDTSETLGTVGGLENLKEWLKKRKKAFSQEARELAIPEPKGLLIFGVPGGGKSLTAKAVSSEWQMPLLRFDLGSVFGQYVGQSEQNMREALSIAESISPCILWIDELEKAFAGASGGHETTVRVLGSFLTWMQEKKSTVFVIATANDITKLPPEFLRKGRFDEMFFVPPPTDQDRREIITILLKKYKLSPDNFDISMLANNSRDFTGAEIEQAIIDAKFNAFETNRDVTTEDIKEALKETTPIWHSFIQTAKTNEYQQLIKTAKVANNYDISKIK